ncbi:MAG: TolC family protein [Gammaproteobacteria bacterium]
MSYRILSFIFLATSAALANAQSASETPLTLTEAARLAIERQPMLEAQAAAVRAARENAIASAQLPDPELRLGVRDVPVNSEDRWSLSRDADTQIMAGVMQRFPAGASRRLRGEVGKREAEMAEQELIATRLLIRRDAALAWIEAWKPYRALELTREAVREAELQVRAVEIAYTANRATQADVLAARVALGLLKDEAEKQAQDVQHARSQLSRWIGQAAYQPISTELPAWGQPLPVDQVIERLRSHPYLNVYAKGAEAAQADVELARQSYRPGWWVEVGYGYREQFSEMASLQVGIDLPVFTRNRQDRGVAAKIATQERAEQLRTDQFRQQEAEARLNSADWALLQERLKRFDAEILPQGEQRTTAALAAWQAGQGTLAGILDARRMALENRIKRLELEADAQKHRVKLEYLAGEES